MPEFRNSILPTEQSMRVRRTQTPRSNIYATGINITISERNQEATLYPQELTSALLIQKLYQGHPLGNTSCDY